MPMQWLYILTHPDVKDKADVFHKLQYEFTIGDAYDLIECLNTLDAYKAEIEKGVKD